MWHFSKGVAGRIGPQTSAALDLAAFGRLRKTVKFFDILGNKKL